MAKTATVKIDGKVSKTVVMPPAYDEKKDAFNAQFLTRVKKAAIAIDTAKKQIAEIESHWNEYEQDAMALRERYIASKLSMPEFCNKYIDSAIPDKWNKGTSNRPDADHEGYSSSVFNGVRTMIDAVGKRALKAAERNTKLLAAGIDESKLDKATFDTKVAEFDKKAKEQAKNDKAKEKTKHENALSETYSAFVALAAKVVVDFIQFGFTDKTISNYVHVIGSFDVNDMAALIVEGKNQPGVDGTELTKVGNALVTTIQNRMFAQLYGSPKIGTGTPVEAKEPKPPVQVPQLTAEELLRTVAAREAAAQAAKAASAPKKKANKK
jgi:hypothetical protein